MNSRFSTCLVSVQSFSQEISTIQPAVPCVVCSLFQWLRLCIFPSLKLFPYQMSNKNFVTNPYFSAFIVNIIQYFADIIFSYMNEPTGLAWSRSGLGKLLPLAYWLVSRSWWSKLRHAKILIIQRHHHIVNTRGIGNNISFDIESHRSTLFSLLIHFPQRIESPIQPST